MNGNKKKESPEFDGEGRLVISDEEIGRMLEQREGGRRAGLGDLPFTQEFYEKEYLGDSDGEE